MSHSIFEVLKQDRLFQTNRLSIYNWNAIEKSTKSKEQLYKDVLKIMTPNVTKDLPDGWQNLHSPQEAERWVEERTNDNHFFVIQLKENKKMIGSIRVLEKNGFVKTNDELLGNMLLYKREISSNLV